MKCDYTNINHCIYYKSSTKAQNRNIYSRSLLMLSKLGNTVALDTPNTININTISSLFLFILCLTFMV